MIPISSVYQPLFTFLCLFVIIYSYSSIHFSLFTFLCLSLSSFLNFPPFTNLFSLCYVYLQSSICLCVFTPLSSNYKISTFIFSIHLSPSIFFPFTSIICHFIFYFICFQFSILFSFDFYNISIFFLSLSQYHAAWICNCSFTLSKNA